MVWNELGFELFRRNEIRVAGLSMVLKMRSDHSRKGAIIIMEGVLVGSGSRSFVFLLWPPPRLGLVLPRLNVAHTLGTVLRTLLVVSTVVYSKLQVLYLVPVQ